MRSTARNCLLAIACALASAIGWAQGRNIGFDWPATGADAQRTGWLRLDPNISVENFRNPASNSCGARSWTTRLVSPHRSARA